MKRSHGRRCDQLRNVRVTYDFFGYSSGSVLFEIGKTKVLCAVTIQNSVPQFLRGTKKGWLTAEYAMLPTSTRVRSVREISATKRNGRSVEISRLIGRALRTVVRLDCFGERTITIDCDVLQADGGTRTACVTGSYLALREAEKRWLASGEINEPFLINEVAAISVGVSHGTVLLDLDFVEDSHADADFNLILTSSGDIIEIQGTSEHCAMSWHLFEEVRRLAIKGVQDLFLLLKQREKSIENDSGKSKRSEVPLFCLKNRNNNVS